MFLEDNLKFFVAISSWRASMKIKCATKWAEKKRRAKKLSGNFSKNTSNDTLGVAVKADCD